MKDFMPFIPGIPLPDVLAKGEILPDSKIHIQKRAIHLHVKVEEMLEDSVLREAEQKIQQALSLQEMTLDLLVEQPAEAEVEPTAVGLEQELIQQQAKLVAEALEDYGKASERHHLDRLYGKKFSGEPTPLRELGREYGRIVVEGEIFKVDKRETKRGKLIYTWYVSDLTDSLSCKIICDKDMASSLDAIETGLRVRLRGDYMEDRFDHEPSLMVTDVLYCEKEEKQDNAPKKRVELHCHTQMSALDGMTHVKDLIARAKQWGHPAIAVTDHGVLQAFPDAQNAAKKAGIKVIYGVECYLVNDSLPIVKGAQDQDWNSEYVVFDLETTGLSPLQHTIIEIGAVKVRNQQICDTFSCFVNPGTPIPDAVVQLTGITQEMVQDADSIEQVLPTFLDFIGDAVLVAHNAQFDLSFLRTAAEKQGMSLKNPSLDTLELSKAMFPELSKFKLNLVVKHIGLVLENHHRATDDAQAAAGIMLHCFQKFPERGFKYLEELNAGLANGDDWKKGRSHHAIILVKNQEGMKNLYEIVSASHLQYFYRTPRVPKSLYMKHREGLMIGSACEAGELYSAIVAGHAPQEIEEIASFYDYLEIQPLGNNAFLVRDNMVENEEALQDINRQIIALGDKLDRPVVATCDVHFMDPEGATFRRILMTAQGFSDAAEQAPLYFRTTEEMLEEFSYLGEEKAYEIVVENTNRIAEQIEELKPVPDGTFPPEMEGAPEELTEMCYQKAKRIYGDPLPEIVAKRMERELEPIVKHGFAVMYMIAQKLVSKSLSDGYLVGSRGSVGSSLIAFMAGITEVNSLVPHYVCPQCCYAEFVTDGSYGCGCDMPNKNCPHCGVEMNKDGYEIPFETFLGFNADKEPDIDLNFSGDYQSVAHKYTEELFGEGHVFRAGTIGTIADKTAYGYVKKYLDETGQTASRAEIERLVCGCTGVKRTTGQHPGGVMIVPRNTDVHYFTPIQHPANKAELGIVTTHFDYHSISGRLLKLDILGHDDPTVIRMLEDLTGLDARTIRLDDAETMSLFTSTKALGVTPEQINSNVGTFGVPEFGTAFVRQMLEDTKPTTFAELIRISGLSHGTDVWLGNAQDLIVQDGLTLMDVICTRDDIMGFLIRKGLPNLEAFLIMEKVRKGKGLTEEDEALMREHQVEEWYIDSCKKIKYMFPKAHAVAYVTMAFRIAYFKVHHPLEYYITYFTVRADDFDAATMCKGLEVARKERALLEANGNQATQKEKNKATILEMCIEMYCRGFSFLPIDLQKSDAVKFMAVDGKLLPPLNALDGLGVNAAKNIVAAREEEEFMSIEDLQIRANLNKTVLEALRSQGCLDGMDESSQMSFF